MIGLGIIALGGMIFWGGGWWIVPILIAFGYAVYVLHRGRSERVRRDAGMHGDGMAPRMTEYPKPRPIVSLIRSAWTLFVVILIVLGIAMLVGMIVGGNGWWIVPILVVFGVAEFVLHRNRARRARA